MKVGTGKPGLCLSNNSTGVTPPEPSQGDRGEPDPVQTSSRCVFLTCDLRDCMVWCERCAWVISQGLCTRPGSRDIRYREPGASCI
jgi:hypothetical protein